MDLSKIDLNAPAFGSGSQTNADVEVGAEASVEAKPETEEVKEEVSEESSVEDNKVPYSRFKKFHDEATELRQRVAELEARRESREPEPASKSDEDIPASWVKLYGDSDASKEAWQIQKDLNEDLISKAREQALDAVRSERTEEVVRVSENVDKLDSNFEILTDYVGRDISEKEQSAILDIVDEFTPKDEDGNYLGEILPFDKAWQIMELKNQASGAPRKASRNNVASLTGSQTQGDVSVKAEQDKNFNPMDWGAYRKRL